MFREVHAVSLQNFRTNIDLEIKRWHLLRFIIPIALLKSRKNLSASFAGNKTEHIHTHRGLDITKMEGETAKRKNPSFSRFFYIPPEARNL